MEEHVPGFRGPLEIERFKGGQSNPTYRLKTPARSYVLRRKPPGLLLKGAHAVEREARVVSALETVGFPVPHVHALCTTDDVIGSWFYVMDMVEGRIFWDASFPEVRQAERAAYVDAMNGTLASLHRIEPDSQDQIDPSYDFEREASSLDRVRQRDDRYAHEQDDRSRGVSRRKARSRRRRVEARHRRTRPVHNEGHGVAFEDADST